MVDFFDRVVARGLGLAEPDAARPRLPQLFERPGLEVQDLVYEAPAAPSAGVPPPAEDRAVGPVDTVVPAPAAPPDSPAVPPPPSAPQPPTPSPASTLSPRPVSQRAALWETDSQESSPLTVSALTGEPVGAGAPPPLTPPGPTPTPPVAPLVARTVPLTPVDPRRADPAAPLARPEGARRERVVRVSIGRLEVTAGPTREPREPRPTARPEPRISLDRFLSHEEGGT